MVLKTASKGLVECGMQQTRRQNLKGGNIDMNLGSYCCFNVRVGELPCINSGREVTPSCFRYTEALTGTDGDLQDFPAEASWDKASPPSSHKDRVEGL